MHLEKKFYLLAMLHFFFLLHLISAAYNHEEVEKGNAFVDELLEDITVNQVHEFDPYLMEDSIASFSKKVVFVNVTGEAKLANGRISGLRTLHRAEDCAMVDLRNRILIKSKLGVGVLRLFSEGAVKFMNYGPTIEIQGEIHYLEVHMDFSVDAETGRDGKLHKFIVDDLRLLKVWISGLGPLNWMVNPILSAVTRIFKTKVRNLLESKVESHIGERLPNYQFPIRNMTQKSDTLDFKKEFQYTIEKNRII